MRPDLILSRLFCIQTSFLLCLVHFLNLVVSVMNLILCLKEFHVDAERIAAIVLVVSYAAFAFALYNGFYGMAMYHRYCIKFEVIFLIVAWTAWTILEVLKNMFNISVINYFGAEYINPKLIEMVVPDPLARKPGITDPGRLKILRRIDSIQTYYACCGWDTHLEWSFKGQLRTSQSCCLGPSERHKAEYSTTECKPSSPSFHRLSCKNAMNYYFTMAHKFGRVSSIVSLPVTVIIMLLSINFMRNVYVDPPMSFYLLNGRDLERTLDCLRGVFRACANRASCVALELDPSRVTLKTRSAHSSLSKSESSHYSVDKPV